jgi:hypothetical protein
MSRWIPRISFSALAFALGGLAACSSSDGDNGSDHAGNTGGSAGRGSGGSPGSGGTSSGSGGTTGAGGSSSGTGGDSAGSGGSTGSGGDVGSGGAGGGTGGPCEYQSDAQFCACLGKTCGGDTIADKDGKFHAVYCGTCTGNGSFCAATASAYGGAVGTCSSGGGLDPIQKQKAEMMTSIWENSTPDLQYDYSQDIGDGRGYTSGRAGFCTGTGDAILVVECYDLAKPGNAMEKYMPALVTINDKFAASGGNDIQGSKTGLNGYPNDWGSSANDDAFVACQDGVADAVYYGVALRHAADRKFQTALTKVALWDAQIMHGESDPRFGMIYQLAETDKKTGPMSDPPTLAQESTWLQNALALRDSIMKMYPEWAGNRYRVSTYEKLRSQGNWDLSKCIVTDSETYTIVTSGTGAKATSGSSCN